MLLKKIIKKNKIKFKKINYFYFKYTLIINILKKIKYYKYKTKIKNLGIINFKLKKKARNKILKRWVKLKKSKRLKYIRIYMKKWWYLKQKKNKVNITRLKSLYHWNKQSLFSKKVVIKYNKNYNIIFKKNLKKYDPLYFEQLKNDKKLFYFDNIFVEESTSEIYETEKELFFIDYTTWNGSEMQFFCYFDIKKNSNNFFSTEKLEININFVKKKNDYNKFIKTKSYN